MSAQLIDGKEVSKKIRSALKPRIKALSEKGIVPGLAAILIGVDPASATYVKSKARACERLKLYSEVINKDENFSEADLIDLVKSLNKNPKIHGILVQSPLPSHINEFAVTLNIDPAKDVDGFHPFNVGMMLIGHDTLLPCTPNGVIKLLEHYEISPSGKEVVVVGRSNIVGKPMIALLIQKGKYADATVTVAHSKTKDLAQVVRRADIIIAATGRPNTITADMVKDGVVIIDVGINRVQDSSTEKGYRLIGDVDFEPCKEKASFITPVPGGVGPMTIAMLMSNTVLAAEKISGQN